MQSLKQSRKLAAVFILTFLVCFSLSLVIVLSPAAADPDPGYYGLDNSAPPALKTGAAAQPLPSRVGFIIGIGLSFIGTIFFVLIIYSGIMWMTAAGNEQQVAKAKDIIIAATIGLVIVLSAYAITRFIGDTLTR